ncbi:hypothetical protein DRJ17_04590 [Candidatus Woesearchaeota archaeon]|nr:MAG: hypothetical protein DRJ17_04590 [Candidatus Woesearchaeota archaeon]
MSEVILIPYSRPELAENSFLSLDLEGTINQAIDEYLRREERPLVVGVYYPSMISYCLRRLFYLYTSPPKPVSSEKLRIFHAGNIIHSFIKEVLEKSEKIELLHNEGEFAIIIDDIQIRGRYDDMILLRGFKEPIVIEVKSIKSFRKWDRERKEHVDVELPYSEHVNQLMIYLYAMRCRYGAIVYVEKPTLQIKVCPVVFDRDRLDMLIDRVKQLHEFIITKTLPPAEAKQNESMRWQCYVACEFREHCDRCENKNNMKKGEGVSF